jgi:hypothetical protein
MIGNYVEILSIDEIRSYGIRSAVYTATCVDRYGRFAHERGYVDLPHESEPFVRATHPVYGMPHWWVGQYWHNKEESTMAHIKQMVDEFRAGKIMTNGGKRYSIADSVKEIKEKMEYVCVFAYCHLDPVEEEAWPEKWMPVVGGLSKYRYHQYLRQLQNKGLDNLK